jgi:hypothetical protein
MVCTVAVACSAVPEQANDPSTRITAVVAAQTTATTAVAPTTSDQTSDTPTEAEPGTGAHDEATPTTAQAAGTTRPDWLGQRPLPTTPDGRVVVPQTTPTELRDRQLATVGTLPPPESAAFTATQGPVPADVLARSTWNPGCPVTAEDLSYLTVSFWGFDGLHHRGELIVHRSVAGDMIAVFEGLHRLRFPIEEMRVITSADLEALPTGDGNVTSSFVCRAVTGGTSFSEHAYGLAIDVNPFHNPYQRGDLVLPELAADYLNRSVDRPGMIQPDDGVVDLFASIGWSWGGDWRSLKDYQHFSHNGR